jgi:4-amino-4-deoxy-L-arabinose transferase-like glycosyltransferase
MNKRHIPFGLIIISLLFILIIRDLFRDGMFMDGLLYASVANNLANGLGSFWHPHFSQTVMPDFHEQPPLLFGIEAVFMKLFRNSIYAERIYGLLVVLISIFLIHKLWKCISQDRNEKNISWLPVLFWLCIPVCYWSYANNMEEPTMGMFDLGAMLFISKSIIQRNRTYLNLFLAALMLIAASMCKGFQGLFPLTAIFFYWVLFKNISFSKMLKNSIFILLVIVAFYGIILLNESVRSSY